MHKTTSKKVFARTTVSQVLSSVIMDLQAALKESRKPQENALTESLRKASLDLQRAADYCAGFHLARKRVEKSIISEIKRLRLLLEQVRSIPITQDEKAVRKEQK